LDTRTKIATASSVQPLSPDLWVKLRAGLPQSKDFWGSRG
jgi:hypothetical protein